MWNDDDGVLEEVESSTCMQRHARVIKIRLSCCFAMMLLSLGTLGLVVSGLNLIPSNDPLKQNNQLWQAVQRWKPGSPTFDMFSSSKLQVQVQVKTGDKVVLADQVIDLNRVSSAAALAQGEREKESVPIIPTFWSHEGSILANQLLTSQLKSITRHEATLDAFPDLAFSEKTTLSLRISGLTKTPIVYDHLPVFTTPRLVRSNKGDVQAMSAQDCRTRYKGIPTNGFCYTFSKLSAVCLRVGLNGKDEWELTHSMGWVGCEWRTQLHGSPGYYDQIAADSSSTLDQPTQEIQKIGPLRVAVMSRDDPLLVLSEQLHNHPDLGTTAMVDGAVVSALSLLALLFGAVLAIYPLANLYLTTRRKVYYQPISAHLELDKQI